LRDELLNGEIFYSLAEAQILIEAWRRHYNTVRPHSSLGYRPPAPEAVPWPVPSSASASLHLRPALAKEAIMQFEREICLIGKLFARNDLTLKN
jgi:putative transposase